MRSHLKLTILILTVLLYSCGNDDSSSYNGFSYFNVPLVCGAAPEIGCGSRIKPLFLDLEKNQSVEEAWTNRAGTIIAIKWRSAQKKNEAELKKIFDKNEIDVKPISDKVKLASLYQSLTLHREYWLKGMAVDSLSLYEAGVIARTLTDFAYDAKLVNTEERERIRKDMEGYFKEELVKVRTPRELNSHECREEWQRNGYLIYEKHIGRNRTEQLQEYFNEHEVTIMKQESCCSEDEESCGENKTSKLSEKSTITCPYCGHQKAETLPTDVCQIRYTCEKCKKEIHPKTGDCCVYCSFGDHKCPSKQDPSRE